mgnify:CR=1 FL=1
MMKGKIGGASWGGAIVVGLILLLAGITVFAPLTHMVINFFKSGGSVPLCTLSLYEGKGIARCPIDDVVIYSDKVEIKYGEQEKYELLAEKKTSTNEMANEALAKLLLTCLERGGGLNSRAFASSGWFNKYIICMECAQITINKDVSGNIMGLAGYLNTNKPKGGISDKKYIELLTKNQNHLKGYMEFGNGMELTPSDVAFEFVPGNDYTAFFVGIKKGSASKWFSRFKAAVSGDFIGAVVGKSDTYYSYIGKPSALGKVCEKKVN